jgi:uridine kinase
MFVIGIAGGSGSGKSTLVDQLVRGDGGGAVAVLRHDAYYRNRADMPEAVRATDNWDHPDALDTGLFVAHIDTLRAGQPVTCPVYDFTTHTRSPATVRIDPRPVLLVEGLLLFAVPAVRERIDLRVFVDTPADLRLARRVARDVAERGRTAQSVVEQYLRTVRPMHHRYVQPSRRHAHVQVPWVDYNPRAVSLLAAQIAAHVPDDPDLAGKAV